MAERSVVIRLQGHIGDFQTKMKNAKASVADVAGEMQKSTKRGEELRRSFGTVADGAGKVGLAAAAGLALVSKAAVGWESAFAGVRKTVDETATTSFAKLEDELRELARTLPATHAEIAGVAEAAGQLGIAADDVSEFTRVMIDLGETTNLTAEEAATGIARFSNVMQLSADDVDRVGSALVELGNNSETTEREILEIGQRMAAAGQIAGLSASDVLAFGATLTSVGVEAEAGGSALSKVFTSVRDAAIDGGEKLEVFAATAGVTTEEFTRAFQDDAAGAVEMFIGGLGRLSESGESTTAVFKELGLTDQRLMRALLSTASAQDHLTDRLEMGNAAWEENTALALEAAARYETSEAKMQVAVNNIKDAMIEFGEVALPVLAAAAEKVSGFAQAVGGLPGPVKGATTSLLGITAVLGGGMWFTSKTINGVVGMKDALSTLGVQAPRTASALGKVGKAAGAVGALLAGLAIAESISKIGDETLPGLEAVTGQIIDMANGVQGAALAAEFDNLDESISRLTDKNAAQKLNDSLSGALGGFLEGGSLREAKADVEAIDQALAGLVRTGAEGVATAFLDELVASGELTAGQLESLLPLLDDYGSELDAVENEAKLAGEATDGAAVGIAAVGDAADGASGDVDELSDAIEGLEAILEGRSEMREYEQSVDDFADAMGERKAVIAELKQAQQDLANAETPEERSNARDRIADLKQEMSDFALTLDIGTQAGRDWEERLDNIAGSALTAAENLSGIDRRKYLRSARQDFINAATELGRTRRQARRLWEDLVDLDDVEVEVGVNLKTRISGPGGAAYEGKLVGDQWATGGYTGSGGKYEPAGVVHRGEYVINAEQTARHFALLERINGGYAAGGPVASRPAPMSSTPDVGALMQQMALRSAPLIGQQTVLARDLDDWRRQTEDTQRLAAMGGADFT